jgi:signal peptidase I
MLGLVAVLWPAPLGGSVSYVMVNGKSMEPTMHLGDVAMLRTQDTYRAGDIIAYRVPKGEVGHGADVIHRIVGGDARHGFVTRGDNNDSNDPWHPHPGDIVGKRWLLLPKAGEVFGLMHSKLAVALFAGAMSAFAAFSIAAMPRRRRTGQLADEPTDPITCGGPEPEPDRVDVMLDELVPPIAPVPGAGTDPAPELPRISWSADRHETPIEIDLRWLDPGSEPRSVSPWLRDALAKTLEAGSRTPV